MFYGVTLMLIVVIMLLVLDHKSLYTRFFVVMFLGVTIAFFFMIQQLSIFADYGAYRNQSNFVQLDWRIFHINPGIGTVYRPLDLLFHISFLIISDLIRIDFHCDRTAPDISRWCFYFCDHIHAST